VYVLDITTWRISPVIASGTPPGWIYRHRARLVAPGKIRIDDATVAMLNEQGVEDHRNLDGAWVLDVARREWRPA
jgi:hypothetical protein